TQVFQVIFVMRTQFDIQQVELSGLTIEPFHLGSPPIIHDLVIDAWRGPTGLHMLFRYDSALFAQRTAEAMIQRFERLLRAAVDHPQARLSELATLSEASAGVETGTGAEASTGVEPSAGAAAAAAADEPAARSQADAH
ncbi:MAG TPA: condensation domain-containing protein, partial [Micromonosporaceae bacterium]|nr:condensation domain-containing protein [Micromonosporaceae bacterium]